MRALCVLSVLLAALVAGRARGGSRSITGALLFHYRSREAWFGSSAIALQGAADPVFMASSYVFKPEEIVGWRPTLNATAASWTVDTTRFLTYQTLYVSAPGAAPIAGVDSLAFWNLKPSGIDGVCVLLGFNSASGPDVSLGPAAPGVRWHVNLTADCTNINGAVPWSRFALSDDGATAVAWTQAASGSITVFAFDGQTGAARWRKDVPCGTPDACNYFLSYGADISGDGRWVVFDEGVVGDGPHKLRVLSAANGTERCAPVLSPDAQPAHISPDGAFMFSSDDATAPSTGAFSTWAWNASAHAFERAGSALPPLADADGGWQLAQYAFSQGDSGRTYLGVVWFGADLEGPSVLALYDAAAPGAGASAWTHTSPLPGVDQANAGAVVDCAGSVCVAGFYTQKAGGPQATVVAVSADAPGAAWNYTTPGSVDAVSIARAAGADSYYVLAVGCTSSSVCTEPGGDLYGFELAVQ